MLAFALARSVSLWQQYCKGRPFAFDAVDQQTAPMALDDVFDNGQSQSGAAFFARSPIINTIEPFCKAGQMASCDAVALISYCHADS